MYVTTTHKHLEAVHVDLLTWFPFELQIVLMHFLGQFQHRCLLRKATNLNIFTCPGKVSELPGLLDIL